jgi:flagellar motor switch protein FliM
MSSTPSISNLGDANERYTFSRAGHIGPEQLRALHNMQDQFARNLTHTLGAWLRTSFIANLVSTEQKLFSGFLATVPEAAYVASLRLEPLGAHGALQIDLNLVSPIVDLLLGGSGRAGEVRDLTEIEEAILFSVSEMIAREFNVAWQASGMHFATEKREREGQLQRLMGNTEKTLCMTYEVVMPEARGNLIFCIPAVVLSSILRKMITQRDRPRRRSAESRIRVEERVTQSRFSVALQFPSMRLGAQEIMDMQVGQIVRLPLPRTAVAELRVGAVTAFCAHPVRAGEHRAAQVGTGQVPPANLITPHQASSAQAPPPQGEENVPWNR